MSYLVFCTFDLKSATSQNYQDAYADLALIGLDKIHQGSNGGQAVIPTTAVMGQFNAQSAPAARDYVATQVQTAFRARRFRSEIFVTAGGDWAWGSRVT